MKRILVVDNDEPARAALAALLRDEGYEIDEAASEIEAMQRMEQSVPDLVVTDLCAPDCLCVGLLNGKIGIGRVTALDDALLEMDVRLEQAPPSPLSKAALMNSAFMPARSAIVKCRRLPALVPLANTAPMCCGAPSPIPSA